MRRALSAGAALTVALAAGGAVGQTVVTPDAGARGLGTTATAAGAVTTIDGGTLTGGNLFHSFQAFGVAAGDTVRWTRAAGDGASVRNVVNRVTGGTASRIDGTLDSTALPNAAFFFINPAGVVFGASAKVNVPAAAYFSTAASLKFSDGVVFAAGATGGSTLSVAAPESFGFVGGQGAIAFQGSTLSFGADASSASFSASDISMTGGSLLARGLDMAAVGSGAATLKLADPLASPLQGTLTLQGTQIITQPLAATAPMRLGAGTMTLGSTLVVSDAPRDLRGGDILVSAGRLAMTGGVQFSSFTRATARGGDIRIAAGDMASTGANFAIASTAASGRSGDVALTGDTLAPDGLTVATTGAPGGTGSAGDISVRANTSLSALGLVLLASNLGQGGAGGITVEAPTIDLGASLAFGSTQVGTPGDISIHGGQVALSAGAYGSAPGTSTANSGAVSVVGDQSLDIDGTTLSVGALDQGAAGSITLKAPRISITGNADISVEVFGEGTAGSILVDGGTIRIDQSQFRADNNAGSGTRVGQIRINAAGDLSLNLTQVSSDTFFAAPGGQIALSGRNVTLTESNLNSSGYRFANAGSISIAATGALELHNSGVSSITGGAGAAGQISISAQSILAENLGSLIASDTADTGRGGDVTIRAGSLDLENQAGVTARGAKGSGDGGTVDIQVTGSLRVADDAFISADSLALGRAGAVKIKAGDVTVDGVGHQTTSRITSDTYGPEGGGGVSIQADSITVFNGGSISSNTFGDGRGGDVEVTAKTVVIDGNDQSEFGADISSTSVGPGGAGSVTVNAGTLKIVRDGFISSDAIDAGNGGQVRVQATTITMDSGDIRSSTIGIGNAGDVRVDASKITLDHFATIGSDAFTGSTGNAGVVNLTADSLAIAGGARVSTATAGAGDAGTVTVAAKSVNVDGGYILSAAVQGATGGSGSLSLTGGAVRVAGGGQISTASTNANPAGQVRVSADSVLVTGADSTITSENRAGDPKIFTRGAAGDAGTVRISAQTLTVAEGGRISTNSYAGAAGEIQIDIPRPGILVLQGATAPGIIQTSSGPGKGGKITISNPLAIVSNGGSLQALGQLRGANVVIQSRYFINSTDRVNTVDVAGDLHLETGLYDVSSGTIAREISVLDASKVLRGQCPSARSTGVVSQLISRPVGPYVRGPDAGAAPAQATARPCR